MIDWKDMQSDHWEGVFRSRTFRNEAGDPELFICIEHPEDAQRAENCVDAFNSLDSLTIQQICMGILRCAAEGGMEEDFELPDIREAQEILDYCWLTTLYIPHEGEGRTFIAEGEGEWGEVIGFVVRDGALTYVGTDYFSAI